LIDTEDLEKVNKHHWYIQYHPDRRIKYYVRTTIYQGVNHPSGQVEILPLMHSLIMGVEKYVKVDHIDYDGLDNRKEKLRVVTDEQNARNRNGKNSNNKSGYRNVAIIDGLYVVQLMINGKNTRLKSFKDVDEAGRYAEQMRQKYYGEFAGTNDFKEQLS
jgi:hypothetical protein